MVTPPKTAWVKPASAAGEYKYIPKPETPKHSRGETKYDKHFDYMLLSDVAVVVPTAEVGAVKRAFQRYERNKAIMGEYSFRQAMNPKDKTHTVWMEKKDEL